MSTTVFVYTMSRVGEVGAWSRYVFPFNVDNFAQLGDRLYIRAGDDVLMVDETSLTDFDGDAREQTFDGIVQTPWLDMGEPGRDKSLIGVDVATMRAIDVDVDIGVNQNDRDAFTAPVTIPGDTVPGTIIPIPVVAPTLSIRLTFNSLQNWQLQSFTAYINDQRTGA